MTARTPILRRRQPARSHTDWTLTRSLRRSCSAEVLAAGQLPDPATDQQRAALGRRLTDTQHKIASLVSAIESGIEPTLLGQQLATRIAEKDRILREIGRLEPTGALSARNPRPDRDGRLGRRRPQIGEPRRAPPDLRRMPSDLRI